MAAEKNTLPSLPGPDLDVAVTDEFDFPNASQAPKDTFNGAGGIGGSGGSGSVRQDLQTTVAAEGNPVRVTYGRDRIGGDIVDAFVDSNNKLFLVAVWGDGPYEQVEKIYLGENLFTGTVRHYTNHSPKDDAALLAEHALYSASSGGYCFSVLEVETNYQLDSLDVIGVIKGRNDLFDQRLSGGAGGTAFSETPALMAGHFADKFLGVTPNFTDVGDVADDNEFLLDPLSGDYVQDRGRYRQQIGITFDRITTKVRVFTTLKDLAQTYTAFEGTTLRFTSNKDEASVGSVVANQIILGSATKRIKSLSKSPNVVTVIGTSAADDDKPWEDASFSTPFPPSGPVREQQVRIPAIQSLALLERKARERLNYYTIIKLEGKFKTRDESIKYLAGNLIDLTDTEGATAKKVRLLSVPATGKGEWQGVWEEHDAAVYDSAYVAEPSVPDSQLPSPNVFPTVVAPSSITERLKTDNSSHTFTVFDIAWTGSPWPWVHGYRIRMKAGSNNVFDHFTAKGDGGPYLITSPQTEVGVLYTVEIWIINVFQNEAPSPGSLTQIGAGNTIPPSDPSGMSGREASQFVSLEWNASVDSNLRGYKVQKLNKADYDAAADGPARWAHANVVVIVERIDSTKMVVANQAVGQFYYMVKGEDFDGNFSDNFSVVLINVTEDVAASIITKDLDQATLVNMHLFDTRRQEGLNGGDKVVTSTGESWTSMFGAAGSLWTDNFSAAERWNENLNVASSVESEEWDTTSDNNGNWQFNINHSVFAGTMVFTSKLAKVADYPTFTNINGQSINGEGRYYKAKLEVAAGLGNGFTATLDFSASFAGVPVENEGTEVVPASPKPVTVTFPKPHGIPPKVVPQLLGSTPGWALADAVTAIDFKLEVWDKDGVNMAGTVDWTSKGP